MAPYFCLRHPVEAPLKFCFPSLRHFAILSLIVVFFFGRPLYAEEGFHLNKKLALVGARIYQSPIVENGKIVNVGDVTAFRVPRDVQAIDCKGKTLAAGFWNFHVHFIEPKWNDAADIPAGN